LHSREDGIVAKSLDANSIPTVMAAMHPRSLAFERIELLLRNQQTVVPSRGSRTQNPNLKQTPAGIKSIQQDASRKQLSGEVKVIQRTHPVQNTALFHAQNRHFHEVAELAQEPSG
jgi:UDP-N-acetylenolpyruvoylglucosamine reductase